MLTYDIGKSGDAEMRVPLFVIRVLDMTVLLWLRDNARLALNSYSSGSLTSSARVLACAMRHVPTGCPPVGFVFLGTRI